MDNAPAPPITHPYAAITDYLTVTFAFPLGESGISPFFIGLCSAMGVGLGLLSERRGGMLGFKRSYGFERHGAMFAFGGQNGRAMLSMPGEACHVVRDWHALAYLRDGLNARITRWDGAVDDFHGEHTVNDAVAWYLADGFRSAAHLRNLAPPGRYTDSRAAEARGVAYRGDGRTLRALGPRGIAGGGESA